MRTSCVACKEVFGGNYKCKILNNENYCDTNYCKFYKTKEQIIEENAAREIRFAKLGLTPSYKPYDGTYGTGTFSSIFEKKDSVA